MGRPAVAALSTDSPIAFFTNVASRLLQSDAAQVSASQVGSLFPYPTSLNSIQIYPTNQYSSALHRILQLAANLYDAATNRTYGTTNGFPTIFRPIFITTKTNGTQVFIVGYGELTDHAAFVANPPIMRHIANLTNPVVSPYDMVEGIPLIIGAKQGFPNFNELELRTKVQVSRKLQFIKHSATDRYPYATNQMCLLQITNEFGVEAWNSYPAAYPRNLEMLVGADIEAGLTDDSGALVLTNFSGVPGGFSNTVWLGSATNIAANSWAGFSPLMPSRSFITPLNPAANNFAFLPTSAFSFSQNAFIPATPTFEVSVGFPAPRWWLSLSSGLRFVLYDSDAQRIVDYVNLAVSNPPFDIMTGSVTRGNTNGLDAAPGSMFLTNRVGGGDATVPTYGIINQIFTSLGMNSNNLVWNSAMTPPPGWDTAGAINFFRTNLLRLPGLPGKFQGPLYLTNVFQAPYAPIRNMYLYTSWVANDPLVHYMLGDVAAATANLVDFDVSTHAAATIQNIGQVNSRYEPWPGMGPVGNSGSPTLTDYRVKDPNVAWSGSWAFPSGPVLDTASLGQVHRGTTWQTLYLKADAVPMSSWGLWTGPSQWPGMGPVLTHPTNDWRHLALLAPLFNTNPPTTLASVNQSNPAAWAALMDGLPVWSNTGGATPSPSIVSSNDPGTVLIAQALDTLRASQAGGVFTSIGQVLSVPALSVNSPWLYSTNANLPGITDAEIEALPAQLLAQLRPDATATVTANGTQIVVQFTGTDGLTYEVQVSPDLVNWARISTNATSNGIFQYVETLDPATPARFFRSVILR